MRASTGKAEMAMTTPRNKPSTPTLVLEYSAELKRTASGNDRMMGMSRPDPLTTSTCVKFFLIRSVFISVPTRNYEVNWVDNLHVLGY